MPGSKANGRIEPSAQAIIEGGHEDAPPQEFFSQPVDDAKSQGERYTRSCVGRASLRLKRTANWRGDQEREVGELGRRVTA